MTVAEQRKAWLAEYRGRNWTLVCGNGKRPIGSWKHLQDRKLTDAEWELLTRHVLGGRGALVVAKSSGVLILDLDLMELVELAERILGAAWATWPRVRTPRGGVHLYASAEGCGLEKDETGTDKGWTVRVEGCMALPFEDGSERRWEVPPNGALPSAEPLLRLLDALRGRDVDAGNVNGDGRPRSLDELLADPPLGRDSGRNDWLAHVAGHYARKSDTWEACRKRILAADASLKFPLQEGNPGELERTVLVSARKWWGDAQAEEPELFRVKVEEWKLRERVKTVGRLELQEEEWAIPESTFTLEQELALPDEEEPFFIDELQPEAGNAVLIASGKTGKSALGVSVLRDLANGTHVLGNFRAQLPEGKRIAYVNFEMPPKMLRRWFRRAGVKDPNRVVVLNLRGQPNPFVSAATRTWLAGWLRERDVYYWVLDSFAAAFTGDSENDNTQVRTFLELVSEVSVESGAINSLVLMHTGHSSDVRARGAKAIGDWPDAIWVMTKADDDDSENDERFLEVFGRDVLVPQGRLEWDKETRTYTDFIPGERKAKGGAAKAKAKASDERLRLTLWENGNSLTVAQIEKLTGENDRQLRRQLGRMKDKGMATVEKRGRDAPRWSAL